MKNIYKNMINETSKNIIILGTFIALLFLFNFAIARTGPTQESPNKNFSAMGEVTEVSSSQLVMSINGSSRTFDPSNANKIESKDYVKLTIEDIKIGDRLIIQGVDIDGQTTLRRIIDMTWDGNILEQQDQATSTATSTATTTEVGTTESAASTTDSVSSSTLDVASTTMDVASTTEAVSSTTEPVASSTVQAVSTSEQLISPTTDAVQSPVENTSTTEQIVPPATIVPEQTDNTSTESVTNLNNQ